MTQVLFEDIIFPFFHINSLHLQLCARMMLLHEDVLSS